MGKIIPINNDRNTQIKGIIIVMDNLPNSFNYIPEEKKLQVKEWQEVCRLVRIRDGHQCQICGKQYGLEIHHKTYYINNVSIVGHEIEHLDCLITLCQDCHAKIHNK